MLNRNQWQCKLLRISSARVKIPQILVIFETTDQFFFKFSINVQGNETYITTLYFLSKSFYILSTKGVYQSTNLVKVYVHFYGLLLSKLCTVSTKKYIQKSYLSWHWRVVQSLKKKWFVVSNVTFWLIFTQTLKSLKISLSWAILSKV